ncbi:helix-turn-helix domain-containing protein [Cupriavidus numazuensis]|uniref:HTH araC/xylS-type domain-containing protein n=1 Tax=Cupriavidus numazuensis TaxID=221992 RepID=A0ABM8TKR7_9BURK|nr:helix-turn-helix domain-containing protein [Cupriavidus numazuensis]CAG2152277.1 hypothetical protein LMG26411_04151 [Cupriavidus numazuensis]
MYQTDYCSSALFDTPEGQARGIPQLNQQYLQTGPGRFDGQIQHFRLDKDALVYRERLNVPVLQEGAVDRAWRTFAIPMIFSGSTTVQGRQLDASAMIGHLPGGCDFQAQTTGLSDHIGIVLCDSVFEIYADYLGGSRSLPWRHQHLIEISRAALQRAAQGIGSSVSVAQGNPSALAYDQARNALRDDLLEQLFCLLIDAEPPQRRQDVTRLTYTDIVNRSRQHLLATPNEPTGVLELTRLLRVSRRTLQTAFLEVAGVTPHVYLRAVRLSSVRRLLLQTSAERMKIRDAAARWGFIHMGKFAIEYRYMFGYLPSETVRATGA